MGDVLAGTGLRASRRKTGRGWFESFGKEKPDDVEKFRACERTPLACGAFLYSMKGA